MSDSPYLAVAARAAIRRVERRDGAELIRRARDSVALHRPWLFPPLTEDAFARHFALLQQPDREGFVVCVPGTGEIAGFVNINNIVRHGFQCGAVGYGAYAPHAGRGHMSDGFGLVLRYAFGPLGLHRLEANIQPGNDASIGLVQRHGFRLEGFSPDFLFIDGAWRDHERWAITADMLSAARGGPGRPG
ncbi:GNAT family N-acetyltransferase [Streptomyces pactum]|uniref:GNAT family N-acetyltransferase n=1 Tax=Streptomyces pactum TaxID=68249 RepID=A0ABS0NRE0_9ACTN|nr:GNAT family protein [Streptomyces pactum]MBH5337728.1 GNAT family N-acetyltransferase [Streptomyces pactum]